MPPDMLHAPHTTLLAAPLAWRCMPPRQTRQPPGAPPSCRSTMRIVVPCRTASQHPRSIPASSQDCCHVGQGSFLRRGKHLLHWHSKLGACPATTAGWSSAGCRWWCAWQASTQGMQTHSSQHSTTSPNTRWATLWCTMCRWCNQDRWNTTAQQHGDAAVQGVRRRQSSKARALYKREAWVMCRDLESPAHLMDQQGRPALVSQAYGPP